jgi:type II secretory ATPase GspE/PulE/Tfp pilus assembly ATPase PilB-like protein
VQPFLIPASLNIIIAQRLVKRVCDECKVVRPLSEIDKTTLQNIKHALSVTPKEELLDRV